MKVLVLGDIHGNLIALEKVVKLYNNKVDQIVCHGDVVNYGPWSNECVELLADINCTCLKGNHEEAYLLGYYPNENKLVKDFFNTTIVDFKHFDIIKHYKETLSLGTYYITHTINNQYYFPDTDISDLHLNKNTIIGHSHYAFHKITDNGKTLTNTGSVGQNRKDISISNFVLLDLEEEKIEIVELNYDSKPLISEMKLRNYPEKCIAYYQNKLR